MRRGISAGAAAAIAFIIGIIIGIAVAYLAVKPPTARPTTITSTVTVTKTLTVTKTSTVTSTVPTTATTPITTTTTTAMTTTKPTTTTPKRAGRGKGPYAKVIETSKAIVIVGPVGSKIPPGVTVAGKKIIVVVFKVNKTATPPPSKCLAFSSIDPAFYRNYTLDALILAARKATDPFVREQLYEAIYKISNEELPILWLGQYIRVRVEWSWVHGRYYHPTLGERFDLLWEDSNAPSVPIGVKNYKNDAHTWVDVTHGWPESFDPAADYETFGWLIWHNIGDTLVTYWKNDTKHLIPDLAVAWAHSKDGKTWYFVIRGGVVAYDPWHGKTYKISAIDVLFTIWRAARLGLDPSWMVTSFIDVNKSMVLSEDEFNSILAKGGIYAEYKGVSKEVKSLKELLDLFGYHGPTAGVVMLKLYFPYSPILSILADPFLSVIPMKYLFDYTPSLKGKYEEALKASNYGKNPAAWAKFIGKGEQEPTHLLLHKYPVGTGPYYVKEYKRGSYIVLAYNPYYWNKTLWTIPPYGRNGVPCHKLVIFLINSDAHARETILKSGEADTGAIPLTRLKYIKGYTYPGTSFKIRVIKGAITPTIAFIVVNTMKPPFNNPLVRKALMYAIPFSQIRKVVYANYLAPLYGAIPSGMIGHNDNIVVHYKFDLAKAKELIAKSGINPSKYSFEIWYNEGNTQREKIASLLQTTWGQLGFKVTVRPLSWPTLLQRTEKGDFQVYIIGWAPDYMDPDDYVGPLLYGGTKFSVLSFKVVSSLSEAASFLATGGK